MRKVLFFLVVITAAASATPEESPLRVPVGEMVEGISCLADPSQTYTLYLPPGFDKQRQWPVLLIFDPRGRSVLAAELFHEAADLYGWILVSSNDTRSDGPMEPNIKALNALWPEVLTRLASDPERIYAAGFSGGGAVAYVLSRSTQEVAGIVACGARNLPNDLKKVNAPVFSTAGVTDFNYLDMHDVDAFLANQGNPHRLALFEGGHTWMPPSVAREAVEWLVLIAMQRDLREIDSELVESLYVEAAASAEELVSGGSELEAARRYREIERTFEGLRETSAARRAADEIEASPEYRAQKKEFKRARAFEALCLERANNQIPILRTPEIPPQASTLARNIRLEEAQQKAELEGREGLAAQRCLNSIYTGLSFYLPRDLIPQHRYAQVATAYELALTIRDDNPVVWYNLACARALLDRKEPAMGALRSALESGFNRTDLLETDPDLDPLREREDFKALVAAFVP